MFEYKIKYFGFHEMNDLKMPDYLNKEGKEGWELVQVLEKQAIDNPNAVANYRFFFKRKVAK